MSRTLAGRVNGEWVTQDLNIYGSEMLNWLGWGVCETYGVYGPLEKEGCRIMARLLRNKANLFEIWRTDPRHTLQESFNLYMTVFGKNYLTDMTTVRVMRDLAIFFDKIDELCTEDDYYNSFDDGGYDDGEARS